MDLLKLASLLFICQNINSLETASIMECFKYVAGKYFKDQMILLLIPNEEKGKEPNWIHDIVHYVIGSGRWSVYLSNDDHYTWSFDDFQMRSDRPRARNIIILISEENDDTSSKISKFAENWLWYSSARIMIIFMSAGTGEVALKNLWNMNRALNTVVMAIGMESIRFFTMEPFPNSSDIVTLNEWNNGFHEENDMYVDKIPSDFRGHMLKVGLSYNEPYILKPKVSGWYEDGLELRIIKALRDNLNLTVEFIEAPKGENPYIANVNGTPSGLFGLIHRRTADMMFLGLRNRLDRLPLGDALAPHTYDRSVWIVPSSISERGTFHNVFEVEVWIVTIITFCLLTCVFILLHRFNYEPGRSPVLGVSHSVMLMCCSQLNLPISLKSQRTRIKIFIVLVYLYALHITSAYDSNLVKMFTGRTVLKFFESPDEATEAGLVAYLFPSARTVYNQSNHKMWNKILKPTGHVFSNDYIKILTIISKNKTAFSLLLENVAKYEIAKRKDPKKKMVHIIDKAFGTYPISMFMSRGHPFTELFDRKVQQLVESGIVNYWLKQFLFDYRHMKRMRSHIEGEQALGLEQFRRFFLFVIVGGWSIATLAFFIEVITGKVNNRKKKQK